MSSLSERDIRRLDLEGMTQDELMGEFAKQGTAPAYPGDRQRMIQTLLDDEFGGQQTATVLVRCPRCNQRTGHTTVGTTGEGEKRSQTMKCVVCGTEQNVPTGANGELFQQNVDQPDETDFSGLK